MFEVLSAAGTMLGAGVAGWPSARAVVIRVAVLAAAVSLAVSANGVLNDGRTSGWLSLIEAAGLLGLVFFSLRRGRDDIRVGAALLAGLAFIALIPSHDTSTGSLLANAAAMAVFAAVAAVVAGFAWHLDGLEAQRARAIADARRDQQLALAHDLHDFVAHDVTAMVVQAQAAQVAPDVETAAATFRRIEESGLQALAAMDRAVGALSDAARADQSRGVEDIEELATRFREASGMLVTVAIDDGVARALSQRVASTAHRLVSEGLTNIWRHAPSTTSATVEIADATLAGHPAASITIRNVVTPASLPLQQPATPADRTGGLGLVGLRERVEALGGQLRAGPTDVGWELRAVVPLERDPSSK